MDGTVISDAVNLASRIESLTKDYHVGLLISEYTYEQLADPRAYDIRPIDVVVVKGKTRPVTLFEVFQTQSAGRARGQGPDPRAAAVGRRGAGPARRDRPPARFFQQCLALAPGDAAAVEPAEELRLKRVPCRQNQPHPEEAA